MKGKDLPSYIHRRKRDGVLLFRKRYGRKTVEIRLETQFPEGVPVPFALHQERERLLTGPTPVTPGKDLSAVIRHYIASPKYRDLKPRTRDDYDKHLVYFQGKMGHLLPRQIERHHVIRWHAKWAENETPHRANYRLRVMSIIMEHAKDMGLLTKQDENPAKGIKAIKYEKQDRQPWPQDRIDAYRTTATGRALLVFELCLGTGQRIGDVLRMKWGDIEADGIKVKQGKTGKALWVPFTRHLRAALASAPRRSVFILTNQYATGPWSYRGASQAIREVREAIGALDYDTHGLRYSAASELLLAGADVETIGAITGQSPEMVRHYTRAVRQKALALKAKEIRE